LFPYCRYDLTDYKGNVIQTGLANGQTFNNVDTMRVSYGIQPIVYEIGRDSQILLLEYPSHVAVSGAWDWTGPGRHNGKIHVLFRDGRVEAHRPEAVAPTNAPVVQDTHDPANPVWVNEYWGAYYPATVR
jgi:prepilin-type processing-associated H-X9-DG protein